MNKARHMLKDVFGYDEFRPMQEDVILNVLDKKDTLAIMPTGSGKSLCYQIPGLIFYGLTVVVSPLISLMQDQINQLNELGIPAVVLNSSLLAGEYRDNINRIRSGQVKFLFVAPETLVKENILSLLKEVGVDLLTIDEAHCISEWGHDFRPEYRMISDVRRYFKDTVCIAMTATATPRVQEDIQKNLNFSEENKFVSSFNRDNLFLQVIDKKEPLEQTVSFLKQFPDQSGIIYCFSREQVNTLAKNLKANGFSVRPYHAGLSEKVRKNNQDLFIKDDVQIIVATVAFGMGINKPNVRFVVHHDLPKSIESYYQEIGRAGRDGLRADCLMLFSYGDTNKIRYFIEQKDEKEKVVANSQLNALVSFITSEDCRRTPLLTYFGENYDLNSCTMCDNCLSDPKEKEDLTIPAQKLLSCIKRTNEIFGLTHIIDVLRGSKSKKVLSNRHDKLQTYGIGREYPKAVWTYIGQQLVNAGFLTKDPKYGSLKFNDKTKELVSGEIQFLGLVQHKEEVIGSVSVSSSSGDKGDYDTILFEQLRQKRKKIADRINMPPYIVFSDRALIEMATFFPKSHESMLNINGVGQVKLQKYGDDFLDIISEYTEEKKVEEEPKIIVKRSSEVNVKKYVTIGREYNDGSSLKEISSKYKIQLRTVLDNLMQYVKSGEEIREDDFLEASSLDIEAREKVLWSLKTNGCEFLKPIFDEFNGSVSYDEISILRLYYIAMLGSSKTNKEEIVSI